MAELVLYYGTGRRKSAIARVYLRPGSGDFKVNGRPFEQYFVTEAQRSSAKQPLLSTEIAATFNVVVRVTGGGVNGQADAVKLGIAPCPEMQCLASPVGKKHLRKVQLDLVNRLLTEERIA